MVKVKEGGRDFVALLSGDKMPLPRDEFYLTGKGFYRVNIAFFYPEQTCVYEGVNYRFYPIRATKIVPDVD